MESVEWKTDPRTVRYADTDWNQIALLWCGE